MARPIIILIDSGLGIIFGQNAPEFTLPQQFYRLAGQALGTALVAALLAAGHGSDSSPALVGAVLTFLAGICSIARLSKRVGAAQ